MSQVLVSRIAFVSKAELRNIQKQCSFSMSWHRVLSRRFNVGSAQAPLRAFHRSPAPSNLSVANAKIFPSPVQTWSSPRRTFTSMAPVERVTEKLETPALDDRSYRVIKLPNKLEALLVHDPETDKASAAVNVEVGSFSDADDMPGMAHAVEHLLFMGTEKVRGLQARSRRE